MVAEVTDMTILEDSDSDTCDKYQISSLFNTKCTLLEEKQLQGTENYILHVEGTRGANCNIAATTSSCSCEIYRLDNNHLVKLDTLGTHPKAIIGVKFASDSDSVLYTASSDAIIRVWDLRLADKLAVNFVDTSIKDIQSARSVASFDVSPNNRLLAAGTELYDGEAFILFWDIRNVGLLGGYWESHTDDITQVKFHPEDYNKLISGSTDGLINVYNLKESSEDDALVDTLNTESSVEELIWYHGKSTECLCCITHTVDVQLWKNEDAEPYAHFRRPDLTSAIKRKLEEQTYIASAHECNNEEVLILVGSSGKDGESLRALKTNDKKLQPAFILNENKQRVRCSWYNKNNDILVTGGESSVLNVWDVKTEFDK